MPASFLMTARAVANGQAPHGRLLRVLLLRLQCRAQPTQSNLAVLPAKGSLMPRGSKGEKRPADVDRQGQGDLFA